MEEVETNMVNTHTHTHTEFKSRLTSYLTLEKSFNISILQFFKLIRSKYDTRNIIKAFASSTHYDNKIKY